MYKPKVQDVEIVGSYDARSLEDLSSTVMYTGMPGGGLPLGPPSPRPMLGGGLPMRPPSSLPKIELILRGLSGVSGSGLRPASDFGFNGGGLAEPKDYGILERYRLPEVDLTNGAHINLLSYLPGKKKPFFNTHIDLD